ncbi:MAG TPA: NAD(P)-dependent oxidoreductase [Gammaproteobacteria bacterium]
MTRALTVGFVGIGRMGWPMARNVAAAGFSTWVYDADGARAERFAAECGGHAAASLDALGGTADLVVTMLPTGRDVRAVVVGADGAPGLASTLRAGAVVVDMSSSDPLGTRELGAALRARGIALIDAPVSGLVAKAETGTLTIMIGTDDEAALARAEPVLRVLGERLVRVGALGCGHAMKALNNVVAATAFTITAEALIVGKRFGLDPAVMVDVMSTSTGRNFHTDVSFPAHVLTRRFATGFALGLLAKDVATAAELSAALGAEAPVIELVNRLAAEGRDEVGADEDNTAIVKRWERLNSVILSSKEHDE